MKSYLYIYMDFENCKLAIVHESVIKLNSVKSYYKQYNSTCTEYIL